MAVDGEATTQRVYLIGTDPKPIDTTIAVPASQLKDCCGAFSVKVLADLSDDDEFKNDRTGLLWWFSDIISTATMELLKWDGSDYTAVDDLDNNDNGIYYALGFFVNDAGEKFVGYQIDWRKVLDSFDAGSYKVKLTVTPLVGSEFTILTSEYCLKAYSETLANKTIKIEYYLNGIMGVNETDDIIRDYGTLNWYNSLRLPGWFGFPKSNYSKDYVIYDNGSRQWVKDEQEQEFAMVIKRIPNILHEIMRTDVMQADTILVTDYNANNPGTFIQKSIQLTGDYAPQWHIMQSKLAGVDLKFRLGTNNLRKNRQ